MRIFRLFKSYGKVVLDTLVNIIPQITNIMALIFLLLFIYSVLGISLFADVKFGDNYNKDNNFRNFPQSIVLLFRCMTGEDWNLVMSDLANTNNCESNQTYKDIQDDGVMGCGTWVSYLYFITFMVVLQMIIINLTVAAVIDGLASARKDNTGIIKKDEINELVQLWSHYDPKATGWVNVTDLVFLLYELPQPMGYGKDRTLLESNKMDINENNEQNIDDLLIKAGERGKKYKNRMTYEQPSDVFDSEDRSRKSMRIQRQHAVKLDDQDAKFLYNNERNIFLRKVDSIRILEHFDIPYYENTTVHFKDI